MITSLKVTLYPPDCFHTHSRLIHGSLGLPEWL